MALTKIHGNLQVQNLTITNAQIANKDAQNPDGILLSKIEDGNLLVKSDGSVAFTAPVAGVAPVAGNDLTTKSYVDSLAQGLDAKESVRAVADSNVALSGTQTIDGVNLVAGDRVLLTGQLDATENGIYIVDAGAWSRAPDANTAGNVTPGLFTFVEEGNSYASTGWVLGSSGPTTLGTTQLPFFQFSAAGQISAGNGLVKLGNVISAAAADASISSTPGGLSVQLDSSVLETGPNGLRLAAVQPAQLLVGDSNGVLAPVSVSGDITLADDGTMTINPGAVTPAAIANGSLPLNKLVSGSAGQLLVTSSTGVPTYVTVSGDATIDSTGDLQLVASAVGTNEIADDAVTGAKIDDNAVDTNHLVDDSVTTDKIDAGAVETRNLADEAVTLAKLETLGSAELILGTSNGNVAVTLSGDVTIDENGVVSVNPATVVRVTDIVKETPSGSGDTFTLTNTPKTGTLDVFVNGILQEPGTGNDYELNGTTITLAFQLGSSDKIRAHYFK